MPRSIKQNFVLNLINTVTGLLFPLITFPYISRVIMANGIGQVQFFQSIIDYIALFTALGIPLYAVREVASIRDNNTLRSKATIEILLLHTILTCIGYLIVFILAYTVAKIRINIPLFLLLSTTLLFNTIGVTWFYQAVEDFKYITLRSLATRVFSLVCLFIFVHNTQDLMYYAGITVIANVGGNVFNFFRLRKYINRRLFSIKDLKPFKHLKPALKIFILNLIISLYINLNTVMLGFLKNETAVGFFTAAMRVTSALLGVISSLGTVLLPRFSNMLNNGQIEDFKRLASKAISFVLSISIPMTIALFFLAPVIIHILCGHGFEPSILVLQILSPIVVFIGFSGIVGMQIFYPQGKEVLVMISTGLGALINFTMNLFLIPKYSQYGAAISTTITEFVVLAVMMIVGKQYLNFPIYTKNNFHYCIAGSMMILVFLILKFTPIHELTYLFLGTFSAILMYGVVLYLFCDNFILEIIKLIKHKIIFGKSKHF